MRRETWDERRETWDEKHETRDMIHETRDEKQDNYNTKVRPALTHWSYFRIISTRYKIRETWDEMTRDEMTRWREDKKRDDEIREDKKQETRHEKMKGRRHDDNRRKTVVFCDELLLLSMSTACCFTLDWLRAACTIMSRTFNHSPIRWHVWIIAHCVCATLP